MGAKKNVDWKKLENEYITDPTATFRSLSERYGISASAIHRVAKEGAWSEKREQFTDKSGKAALEKLISERAKDEAKRLKKIYKATDTLIEKVYSGISKVDPRNTLAVRQLCSSLKEVRIMEGIDKGVPESGNFGVVILPEQKTLTPPEDEESEETDDARGAVDSAG